MADRFGVVLINLGTPEGPEVHHVKKYLKEFLMDPLVVDIVYPLRWFLVNQIILRTRPKNSSRLYKKIWTEKGSPLLFHTLNLSAEVQKDLGKDFVVVSAMRYGKPSIEEALQKLKGENVQRILALPLYPQYSLAATQSSMDECLRVTKRLNWNQKIEFCPAFYNHGHFTKAFADVVKNVLDKENPDRIIFSFHGIPERHVRKTDVTGKTCLVTKNCCDSITENNKNCYRAQCFATARAIAKVPIGANAMD
jgi:ferrochelatase